MAKQRALSDEELAEKALLYVKNAPLIGHPGWMHLLKNEHFFKTAMEHRIKEALNIVKEEAATEYEALLYLHTASLAAPLSTEWSRIFFYLFDKFYGHIAPEKMLEGKLTDTEKQSLLDLRKWIFKNQMKAISDKLKASKKSKKKSKQTVVEKKEEEQPQQAKKTVTVPLTAFI